MLDLNIERYWRIRWVMIELIDGFTFCPLQVAATYCLLVVAGKNSLFVSLFMKQINFFSVNTHSISETSALQFPEK